MITVGIDFLIRQLLYLITLLSVSPVGLSLASWCLVLLLAASDCIFHWQIVQHNRSGPGENSWCQEHNTTPPPGSFQGPPSRAALALRQLTISSWDALGVHMELNLSCYCYPKGI